MLYLMMHSTLYLWFYGIGHMVTDQSDSETGNVLLPHRLLFLISTKGSFICTIPQTGLHIPQPFFPSVSEQWLNGSSIKDRSDDPLHNDKCSYHRATSRSANYYRKEGNALFDNALNPFTIDIKHVFTRFGLKLKYTV